MYTYEMELINEVNAVNAASCLKLFEDHFPEVYSYFQPYMEVEKLDRFICAKDDGEIIGAMGVLNNKRPDDFPDGIVEPDYYQFFHLVVHPDHTGQGIATGIIRTAISLLHGVGAKKIKNHKRENIISRNTFEELGFVLKEFDDEEPDYKWTYLLDFEGVDFDALETIWSQYDIRHN